MRVGVDAANLLADRRGIGRYVRSLLRAWHDAFSGLIEPVLLVPNVFPNLIASRLTQGIDVESMSVARRQHADRLGLDLLWYPWNGMTWTSGVRAVVTLHDLWPFVSPASDERRRAREQGHYRTAAAHAARFIAVSRHTAAEATAYLGIDPKRIDVVPHGVALLGGADIVPARFAGADRYVLFVGESEPRKDIATLLDAAARLPEALRRTTAIVVAGRSNGAHASRQGVRVESTGEVSDQRLAALYAGAAAFAFPSRYEGFGLPVLEAMAHGTPVVASNAAAIPEAAGDAALYFTPGDADGLAQELARVLADGDLARRLAQAGRERVRAMSHVECARRTLEVFERALAA